MVYCDRIPFFFIRACTPRILVHAVVLIEFSSSSSSVAIFFFLVVISISSLVCMSCSSAILKFPAVFHVNIFFSDQFLNLLSVFSIYLRNINLPPRFFLYTCHSIITLTTRVGRDLNNKQLNKDSYICNDDRQINLDLCIDYHKDRYFICHTWVAHICNTSLIL